MMFRKEVLCDWFKALPAHKRVDYLCGLLRMCLPLELRFIGSFIEDLAKKDFHILRDQEIKANQRADLLSNNSRSLSDEKLRAKIITVLALMKSTNSSCAGIVYDILQQEFKNMLGLLHNAASIADLNMILILAVHHPAFTFYQRNQLGQVLENVEGYIRELFGDDLDDVNHLIVQQTQTYQPDVSQPKKDMTNETLSYPQKAVSPSCLHMVSYARSSSLQSQMSSTTSSPIGSRTSSPSPLTFLAEDSSYCAAAGNLTSTGGDALQPACPGDQTFQLLCVLNLQEYYYNLKDNSLQQIFHMNKEELANAGLPPEAQAKLKSRLSIIRHISLEILPK